uniref:Rho GTPase-activating protein 21 n=1 Tax=Strigamia maritima TaxID=126957 RepID=T1J8D5_STRMM
MSVLKAKGKFTMDLCEKQSDDRPPNKEFNFDIFPCNPNSWSGPRTVLLKRNEHGFGFTLRHFIVYPPDILKDSINEWADKQDAEKIPFPSMDPMDTIFVKNVKEGGPADRAGLAAGDRIVSVNGETIRAKTYPQVVQMIQKSDNNLQLLVVPKEDDILQLYFPGSAYNPGADEEAQTASPRQTNSQIHTIYPQSSSSSSSISNLSLDSLQRWHNKPSAAIPEYSPRFYGTNEQPYQSSTTFHMPKNQRPTRFSQPVRWNRSYEIAPPEFQTRFASYENQTDDGRSKSNSDLFLSQSGEERKFNFPAFFNPENRIYDSNENLEPQHFLHNPNETNEHFYGAAPTNNISTNPIRPVFSQIYVPSTYPQHQQSFNNDRYVMPSVQNQPVYANDKLSNRDKFFRSCNAEQASVRDPPYGAFEPLTDRMKAGIEKRQEFLFSSPFQEPFEGRKEPLKEMNFQQKYVSPHLPVFKSSVEQNIHPTNLPALPVKCTSTLVHFPANNLDEESATRPNSKAFVSKLGRIQENITSGSLSDCATHSTSRLSHDGFSTTKRKALMSPLRKANSLDSDVSHSINNHDNENVLQLQLVSQRAKLFESGSVESESRNRLKLYQNELSRLSTKGKTTSVSERTAQFESLSTSQETVSSESEGPLIPRHRISLENKKESKELRWQRSQSDNVTPGHYSSTTSVPKTACATTVQVASNVPSMSTTSEPSFIDDEAAEDENDLPNRRKAVRQNSYLQAVHSPYKDRIDSNNLNRFYSTPRFQNRVPNHPLSRESSSTPSLHLISNGLPANDIPDRQISLHGADCSSLFEEGSISRLIAAFDSMLAGNAPVSKANIILSTPAKSDSGTSQHSIAGIVLKKKSLFEDEAQNARRVAYLKATADDRMRTNSEADEESEKNNAKTPISQRSHSIQKLKAFFGEKTPQIVEATEHMVKELPSPVYDVIKEGWLHCKTALLDGKRATDRSWKQLWACLRGSTVYLFKDKKDSYQLPLCLEEQPVVIKPSSVDIAYDYTKKKNVFRLITATGSEYLLQAEDNDDMLHWIKLIQEHYQANNLEVSVPRRGDHMSRLSPQPVQKGIKKLTSFRNRSPTGHSPLIKIKRTAQGDEMPPKAKTWRGKMAKTIKKIHSTSTTTPAEGVTVNVPLEECPPSSVNEFVPLIVELCTSIVEARGSEMVGIYRVPGNTAAVTTLLEAINKGFDTLNLQDPRWNDVNVISSVLKGFFRKLPDPLVTSELYPLFIEANKLENTTKKLLSLKKLLHELPDHHYETLKYLIRHLQKIVLHSNINKMEARNLAIVFGPTIVRAADDNMVTMVNDMSHQCCIVELLINKADWFFNDDDTDDIINQNIPESIFTIDQQNSQTISNQNLLLNNITKMEDVLKPREICVRDIVTSIINAANRKVRQRVKKQSVSSVSTFGEDAGFEERDIDREVELRRQRVQKHQNSIDSAAGRPGSAETKSQCNRELTTSKRTISADSLNSLQMQSTSSFTDGSTLESGELFYYPSETVTPEKLGDEVVFRTYAGLSANTQERIRRFEMETRALLQRNLNRQNQDSERRKLERRRIELEWQRAKQDLDQEILLDELANRVSGDPSKATKHHLDVNSFLSDYSSALRDSRPSINSQSSSSDYSSNASPIVRHRMSEPCNQLHASTLITSDYNSNTSSPLSTTSSDVKVDKSGTTFLKSQLKLELTSPKIDGKEKIIDVALRRGCSVENVTDKLSKEHLTEEESKSEGKLKKRRLSSIRCGSLDSLREYYDKDSQSGVEEGGDLLNSITNTLNQRLRVLFEPNGNEAKENKNSEIKICEEKIEPLTPQAERKRRYRDPSLHRTREKSSESPKLQKASLVTVKHNATITEVKVPHAHRNCCSACPYLKQTTKDEKGDVNTQKKTSKTTTAAPFCLKNTITTSKVTGKSQDNPQNKNKCNQRHNEMECDNHCDNHCEKPLDVSVSALPSARCKNGVNRSVKRRHTVGGTKDFEHFRSVLNGTARKSAQKSAWERLRPETDENQSRERNIKSWLQRERLRTSSPDLSAQKLFGESTRPDEFIEGLKNQQRRISFPDIRLASLQLSQTIAKMLIKIHEKMKLKMAEGSEYFSIGSIVTCKSCFDKQFEGEVLAFDPQTRMLILNILSRSHLIALLIAILTILTKHKLLILRCNVNLLLNSIPQCQSSNGKGNLKDLHMINLGNVSHVEVKKEASNGPPPVLQSLNIQKLSNRVKQQTDEKMRLISAMSADVSPEGQQLFLTITKTIEEVAWNGPNIVVMNQVTISPPYKPENCKGAKDSAVAHVKKIVEKYNKDQQVLAVEENQPAATNSVPQQPSPQA